MKQEHRATIHRCSRSFAAHRRANDSRACTSSTCRPSLRPIAAAVAERMAAIYPLLDENERHHWSSMVATMPTEELTRIQRELLRRTPDEGVAFLRSSVLRTALRLPS